VDLQRLLARPSQLGLRDRCLPSRLAQRALNRPLAPAVLSRTGRSDSAITLNHAHENGGTPIISPRYASEFPGNCYPMFPGPSQLKYLETTEIEASIGLRMPVQCVNRPDSIFS